MRGLSTLRVVRALSIARVLFTILAFQLVVGLQVSIAHVGTHTSPTITHAASKVAGAQLVSAHTADRAIGYTTTPTGGAMVMGADKNTGEDPCPVHSEKHDCCKTPGCHCLCSNTPFAFSTPVIRSAPTMVLLQAIPSASSPCNRADPHFRPPIVS